jgi:hypothetical protein
MPTTMAAILSPLGIFILLILGTMQQRLESRCFEQRDKGFLAYSYR